MTTEVDLVDPAQVERIRPRFQRLATQWKEASRYLSNTTQMAMLPEYQRIVGIGWPAVPLILDELRREPDHWFWALEAITDHNPVPSSLAGQVAAMAECWLDWGREQGLIDR